MFFHENLSWCQQNATILNRQNPNLKSTLATFGSVFFSFRKCCVTKFQCGLKCTVDASWQSGICFFHNNSTITGELELKIIYQLSKKLTFSHVFFKPHHRMGPTYLQQFIFKKESDRCI